MSAQRQEYSPQTLVISNEVAEFLEAAYELSVTTDEFDLGFAKSPSDRSVGSCSGELLTRLMLCALVCSKAQESIEIEEQFSDLAFFLEKFSGDLRQKATALQLERSRHSNSLLHVTKLPPDILSEIFLYTCFGSTSSESTPWLSPDTLPRNYRQLRHNIFSVCHYWHSVVLTTSALWSHILIDDRGPDEWSIITLELQRSANRSLSFLLEACDDDLDWFMDFPAIRNALKRAKSICIRDLANAGIVECLFGLYRVPHRLPCLQFFSAEVGNIDVGGIDLSRAPALERLHLKGRVHLRDVSTIHLTHVDVSTTIKDEGIDLRLLSNASQLKDLKMTHPDIPPSLHHDLPALQRLDCRFELGVEAYIASLVAPNLAHLTLTPWETSPFTSQFPALESLTIPQYFEGDPALMEGLRGILTLQTLRLFCADAEEWGLRFSELAYHLSQRDESGGFVLLPHLREVIVHGKNFNGHEDYSFEDEFAEALLLVRNKGVAEQPDMPFRLTLLSRRTTKDFLMRHPWSVSVHEADDDSNASDDGSEA